MFFRQNPSDVRPKTEPPHCSIRARNLISSLGSVRLRLPSPIFIDFQTFAILPSSDDDSYQFDIYHRPPFFSARFFSALPPSSHSIESKYAYRDLLLGRPDPIRVSNRTCRMAPKVTKSFCRTPTLARSPMSRWKMHSKSTSLALRATPQVSELTAHACNMCTWRAVFNWESVGSTKVHSLPY